MAADKKNGRDVKWQTNRKCFTFQATIRLEGVAKALEDFLSSVKNMEVQGARTADGYVIQGRQTKDGWKTIPGMRMATTIQLTQIDSNLNVVVGQGEWSDKIGAGAVGLFIAWPLAVTAGIGAYRQKKLPEEIFEVVERYLLANGGQAEEPQAQAAHARAAGCLPFRAENACQPGSKFCDSCGAKLENRCAYCGSVVQPGSRFCPECGHQIG